MTPAGLFDLSGRNAVVTGGAMGIGFGIVRRYVEAGANVAIGDLDASAAQRAARELAGGPGKVAAMAADVRDVRSGQALVDRCVDPFGSPDIFVNNAGIYSQIPMLEMARSCSTRSTRSTCAGSLSARKRRPHG